MRWRKPRTLTKPCCCSMAMALQRCHRYRNAGAFERARTGKNDQRSVAEPSSGFDGMTFAAPARRATGLRPYAKCAGGVPRRCGENVCNGHWRQERRQALNDYDRRRPTLAVVVRQGSPSVVPGILMSLKTTRISECASRTAILCRVRNRVPRSSPGSPGQRNGPAWGRLAARVPYPGSA
jgi:hypothetical protein